jgi:hypothetical protein
MADKNSKLGKLCAKTMGCVNAAEARAKDVQKFVSIQKEVGK